MTTVSTTSSSCQRTESFVSRLSFYHKKKKKFKMLRSIFKDDSNEKVTLIQVFLKQVKY